MNYGMIAKTTLGRDALWGLLALWWKIAISGSGVLTIYGDRDDIRVVDE